MQCPESPYNKKYSHAPNSIKDPEYSINCGMHYLADCLKQARCKSPIDMNHIRLALQGYNYGNGYSSRTSWCGCFVSWCENQCGYIKSGTIPKFSWVPDIVDWAKSHHHWQSRNYKPSPGDIIIIDWYANGTRDHVGLVERCDGRTVYTIEGNRSDAVRCGSYSVGSGTIYGYCVPRY